MTARGNDLYKLISKDVTIVSVQEYASSLSPPVALSPLNADAVVQQLKYVMPKFSTIQGVEICQFGDFVSQTGTDYVLNLMEEQKKKREKRKKFPLPLKAQIGSVLSFAKPKQLTSTFLLVDGRPNPAQEDDAAPEANPVDQVDQSAISGAIPGPWYRLML